MRLYVRVLGSGSDTLVVCCAAWLAHDLARLATGRTLIFYDSRSMGASDTVSDPEKLGMNFEVSDIEVLRRHFGLDHFSLLGWSYRGAVVVLYAAEYPEHIRSVVQIGPMAPRSATSVVDEQRSVPPDAADVAYLSELAESDLESTNPVRYCREILTRQWLKSWMLSRRCPSR